MNSDERDGQDQAIDDVTRTIIGGAFDVANELGCGFLEKVYENALALELRRNGLRVSQQQRLWVHYRDEVVGEYAADLVVNDRVLVESKVCKGFDDVHFAQCLNYLRATGLEVCLLMNFGLPRIQIRRLTTTPRQPLRPSLEVLDVDLPV